MSVLIVIPARMKATRLPNKPLADIGGVPMVVQVMRRALESGLGEVIVACDGEDIARVVRAAGGVAVITDPNHPSGSDRIWEVVASRQSPVASDIIINLQGDLPTFDPTLLHDLLAPLQNPAVDIATLAAQITRAEEHENPAVVKAIIALKDNEKTGRALYFTRSTAPANDGPRYHHIGVYAYRYAALKTFVSLPPSPLERREKLEQLRALEAGLRIDVSVVDTVPLGVDTPEDLARARAMLQ
ncbi:MAG: 3-deoxy-manno-octulosonate cytidylyltransferase [Rickettsiales bacterium]|nr:3-deoxy-manno-octulosonate cytidylyltransferase [Rickettsiales bacterium]